MRILPRTLYLSHHASEDADQLYDVVTLGEKEGGTIPGDRLDLLFASPKMDSRVQRITNRGIIPLPWHCCKECPNRIQSKKGHILNSLFGSGKHSSKVSQSFQQLLTTCTRCE